MTTEGGRSPVRSEFQPMIDRLKANNPRAERALVSLEELFYSRKFDSAAPIGTSREDLIGTPLMGFRVVFLEEDELKAATFLSVRDTFKTQITEEVTGVTTDVPEFVLENPFVIPAITEEALATARESVKKEGLTTTAAVVVRGRPVSNRLVLIPEIAHPISYNIVVAMIRSGAIREGVTQQKAQALGSQLLQGILRLEPIAIAEVGHFIALHFLHITRDQQDCFVLE